MNVHWRWFAWRELDPDTLYALLKLRSDVFVVEQNCVFPEMDGLDPRCEHLCGLDASGKVVACLRLLPPGLKYPEPSIGRLVVAPVVRKLGLGRVAMQKGIERCRTRFPGEPIVLSAQQYLEVFYGSLGFVTTSKPYLDDGIVHVDMRLA